MNPIARFIEARYGGKAELYERVAGQIERAGVAEIRAGLARDLRGRVLEVGCGTGLNFRHYSAESTVTAIDPVPEFRALAVERAAAAAAPIEVRHGDAQSLEFADGSFDAALVTLVFCSVPDAARALVELRRVVRPGGSVRFFEHVRSTRRGRAFVQNVLNPIWCRVMDGCNLNRNTVQLIERAGFHVAATRPFDVGGAAGALFPMVEIEAHA